MFYNLRCDGGSMEGFLFAIIAFLILFFKLGSSDSAKPSKKSKTLDSSHSSTGNENSSTQFAINSSSNRQAERIKVSESSEANGCSNTPTLRNESSIIPQTSIKQPTTISKASFEEKSNAFPFSSTNLDFMELVGKMKERYHLISSDSRQIVADINGHSVVFRSIDHSYSVDGKTVPSITQVMKMYGPNIYSNVPTDVLARAAAKGTDMHNTIEKYEALGISSYSSELEGYKRLKRSYGLNPVGMEVMVVIFDDNGNPLCAGRLDFLLFTGNSNSVAIMDLKRTSSYHAENVSMQLNLYLKGFEQCFGIDVEKLICLRLRDRVAEYHTVKIGDPMADRIIKNLSH